MKKKLLGVLLATAMIATTFAGTGYNENTRYYPDFASRLYFMEAVES